MLLILLREVNITQLIEFSDKFIVADEVVSNKYRKKVEF
jgi:hypothetical protein